MKTKVTLAILAFVWPILLFLLLSVFAHGAGPLVVPLPSGETAVIERDEQPAPEPAKAVAVIVRPENPQPGGLVKLLTDGSVGTIFKWSVPENLPESHYHICDDNRTLVISSATAGNYSIGFFVSDGRTVDLDRITVVVGNGVSPLPPVPPPTPTPPPVVVDTLTEWILQNAPREVRKESLALADVYEKTANLIRDQCIVNGAGARGIVRNESLDALLAVSPESHQVWKQPLDGLFLEISKRISGPDDMAGLEKYYREAAGAFRQNAQLVEQGTEESCPTNSCPTPKTTRDGSPTSSRTPVSRLSRRLIVL